MRKLLLICAFMGLFCQSAFAASETFVAGKDYQIIKSNIPSNLKLTQPGKISVVEFFNYGCPACYALEPTVTTWLATKPSQVSFDRVPVVFHPEWQMLSKAYFTAKALNALPKIQPALFKAIHENGQTFNTEKELQEFFTQQSVKKEDFESVFEFSPGMEAQLQKSQDLMNTYQIYEIPSFVINGKYRTNLRMAHDPQRLTDIINFLVKTESNKN